MSGNCVGLHPHGPCGPGEGCNATPDPAGLRAAELEAELREERESHAATWKRAADNGAALIAARAEIERLRTVAAKARELRDAIDRADYGEVSRSVEDSAGDVGAALAALDAWGGAS